MNNIQESNEERSIRILNLLKSKYPNKKTYDLDGRKLHFTGRKATMNVG